MDSSVIVAIAFGERGAREAGRRLEGMERVFASQLLESEVRAAYRRAARECTDHHFSGLQWIQPRRSLRAELVRAHAAGRLRGADAWHLAVALYAARDPAELTFITADARQRAAAQALGFRT